MQTDRGEEDALGLKHRFKLKEQDFHACVDTFPCTAVPEGHMGGFIGL